MKRMKITLVYRWRIFRIHAHKHWRMIRLAIAGRLLKLTNWISPDLMREYDATILRTQKSVRF